MKFVALPLVGAWVIEPTPSHDSRGFFCRTFCRHELTSRGLSAEIDQCSLSFNHHSGTLRGMHYQVAPHQEVKIIRCTRGAVYDVIIDLRPDSATFKRWAAVTLTADNGWQIYVPQGMAHGFLTLTDGSELFYQISTPYHPESARGVRWNDPSFAIDWPAEPRIIADRDQQWPDFHTA
ncbi:MAG: dTDP-4-dehydrorhamnose 3,5-epimerase [Magnetococcales bacterium]|nr:dTDP-4-dehydrorhamnose 3,5-epimerase [Magnetococcales bacterium]